MNNDKSDRKPWWHDLIQKQDFPQKASRFRETLDRDGDEKLERTMREQGRLAPGNYPYFREPDVYLVHIETAPDGSCILATESTPQGEGIIGFLSPVDAMMEGILRAKPGLRYKVEQASKLPIHYFRAMNNNLTLFLHLSWFAQDRRVILRRNGIPCRLWRAVEKAAPAEMPARFEVDALSLDEAAYLYERAGLFAWEDHLHYRARKAAAVHALRKARPMTQRPDTTRENVDLALFDPEAREWHFMPLD